jgi:hypothetical protein
MRLLCVVLLAGCTQVHVGPREPEVEVSAALHAFIAELHTRMQGHTTLPDRETLLCLTGTIRGHRIRVEGMSATTLLDQHARGLSYVPCRGPRVLGTYHTHLDLPSTDACRHSPVDIETFRRQDHLVALISCTTPDGVALVPLVRGDYWRKRR